VQLSLSWNKLSDRYKGVLFITCLIVGIWLFYFSLIVPQQEQITVLAAQAQVAGQRVRIIETFALAYPDADKYLTEVDKKFAQANRMLPDNLDIREFLLQMEGAAKAGGVQLVLLQPGQSANKNGYREIPIEITIKGNFFQMASFLKRLEDSARFCNVVRLSLQSQPGGLESKLAVLIYSFGITQPEPTAPKK